LEVPKRFKRKATQTLSYVVRWSSWGGQNINTQKKGGIQKTKNDGLRYPSNILNHKKTKKHTIHNQKKKKKKRERGGDKKNSGTQIQILQIWGPRWSSYELAKWALNIFPPPLTRLVGKRGESPTSEKVDGEKILEWKKPRAISKRLWVTRVGDPLPIKKWNLYSGVGKTGVPEGEFS